MTEWDKEKLLRVGDDISNYGVSITWSRINLKPLDEIKLEGEKTYFISAIMEAITRAKGMTVTHARKAIEDVISLSIREATPNNEFVNAIFKYGNHWNCGQGWTEKQLKSLLECVDNPTNVASSWVVLALNKNQRIAIKKRIDSFRNKKEKRGRKPIERPHSAILMGGHLSSWPFGKHY